MKQEFTPPMFKAKRSDGNGWVEGDLINWHPKLPPRIIWFTTIGEAKNEMDHQETNHEINPSTLCMDSGLTAEWTVSETTDPKIWSGDVLETENIWHRGELHKWEVVYKNAAFHIHRTDDEEVEVLLYKFLENNVYTKIGSIHENEGK